MASEFRNCARAEIEEGEEFTLLSPHRHETDCQDPLLNSDAVWGAMLVCREAKRKERAGTRFPAKRLQRQSYQGGSAITCPCKWQGPSWFPVRSHLQGNPYEAQGCFNTHTHTHAPLSLMLSPHSDLLSGWDTQATNMRTSNVDPVLDIPPLLVRSG